MKRTGRGFSLARARMRVEPVDGGWELMWGCRLTLAHVGMRTEDGMRAHVGIWGEAGQHRGASPSLSPLGY
eukprot:3285515-Rhodomonas_salina.2